MKPKPRYLLSSDPSDPIYERFPVTSLSSRFFEEEGLPLLFIETLEKALSSPRPCAYGRPEEIQRIFEKIKKMPYALYQILIETCDLFRVSSETSLFTGYFEPVLKGSRFRSDAYPYPVYARPEALIVIEDLGIFQERCSGIRIAGTLQGGTLHPYLTREEIEIEGVEADVLCYTDDPFRLYFMHVQGSGFIHLEEGGDLRLSYDGTNGYPYTSIGRLLIDRGEISEAACSMETVLAWLGSHPEEASSLLRQNKSYVFFKENGREGPVGSFGIPLRARRSLAVDSRFTPLGCPLFLKTPAHRGVPALSQVMFAHDVGGAIKGPVRGDIYWGSGQEAGRYAGLTKTSGELFLILPKSATLDRT